MVKLCLYFNIPPLYRKNIFKKIDSQYDCEWYFEKNDSNIVSFDRSILRKSSLLSVLPIKGIYWTHGLIKLLSKECDNYLMVGATRNLSLFVFLLIKNLFYRKKKVYLWTHGYYGKESKIQLFLLKRPLLKMADGIFLYGNYAKDLMTKDGFSEKKLFVIHNSLDYDKQLELRKSLSPSNIYLNHFGNNNPVLIFIGRLTEVKRLDLLISAVGKLRNKGKLYNVVFVGAGEMMSKLKEQVETLGLNNNVWFYGACYDERTNAEMIFNADLCVAPGNVGLTAIHSLMFGCPVLTHDDFNWQMPEFESIIPNITGSFFARDNINSLTNHIDEWFETHQNRRNDIRENCYHEIDNNWNPNFQIDILNKVIEQ